MTATTTIQETRSSEGHLVDVRKGPLNDLKVLQQMILGKFKQIPSKGVEIGRYVALDCGMVGVGPTTTNADGDTETSESSLARVSIVNFYGETILDVFVKQKEQVTDYRTSISGIRSKDLVSPDALVLEDVQKKVAHLIKERVLVGYAVHHHLKVIQLTLTSPTCG